MIKANDRIFSITLRGSSSIWIRFTLMVWFELLIACFTGLNLENVISTEMRTSDMFALKSARVFLVIGAVFLVMIMIATVVRVLERHRAKKVEQSLIAEMRRRDSVNFQRTITDW